MDNDAREVIKNQPCSVCGQLPPNDPAHIKTRGSGATFEEYEMIPLCRLHHIEQGWGWKKFLDKYPHLISVLESKGWVLQKSFGIYKLRRM